MEEVTEYYLIKVTMVSKKTSDWPNLFMYIYDRLKEIYKKVGRTRIGIEEVWYFGKHNPLGGHIIYNRKKEKK